MDRHVIAAALDLAPRGCALLLRHAERPDIPSGTSGEDVPITGAGRAAAEALGAQLGGRVGRLAASPVRRCIETAEAIAAGAGLEPVVEDLPILGGPGLWVEDPDAAFAALMNVPAKELVARYVREGRLPGLRPLADANADLLARLRRDLIPGRVDVFVSHDGILAAFLAPRLGLREVEPVWPRFLEGVAVGGGPNGLDIRWRGRRLAATGGPDAVPGSDGPGEGA